MLLTEVFDQLAVSELNNLCVVDQTTKQIDPEMYGRVSVAINAGLTALHTRFLLRTGKITVVLQGGESVYKLHPSRMAGKDGVLSNTKYIRPAPDFIGTLLKIQEVKSNCGTILSMNTGTDWFNVTETSLDTIEVPTQLYDRHGVRELHITYRQDHKQIPVHCDGLDPECYGLTLPRSHLWALCLFVAARMHLPVGLQDATYSGNSFMALYNTECTRLESQSLQIVGLGASEGVVRKGFP